MAGGALAQGAKRALFGGAITVEIPDEFADVSQIREVPDNQEVFAHAETDRSVIVELLQQEPDGDMDAASRHFATLARDAGALEARADAVLSRPAGDFPLLMAGDPHVQITVAHGPHRVSKFRDGDRLANVVHVYLACVRLPRVQTDLLVVFNDPVELHPEGASARLGSEVANPAERDSEVRAGVFLHALQTLEVKNWDLFC